MARFTIIVPVFQTREILRLFLDSLRQTISQDTDIIFVNDGSGPYVQSMLQTFGQQNFPTHCSVRTTVLEHRVSQGAAVSINAALKRMDKACDYVVFLDSDTILQDKWQDQLLPAFVAPDVGAAGGVLLYPQSGGIQCCGITYCGSSGRHLYLNALPDMLPMTSPFEVQSTVFAFCCFRLDAIKEIGLLDERFFNGYEDLDYQFRLREAGYRIVTVPEIRQYHWEKSNGTHREFNRKSNLGRFWKKHGQSVKDDLFSFLQARLECLPLGKNSYDAFDFCEGRADAMAVRLWLNEYPELDVDNWTDISFACRAQHSIWLPELLDSGMVQSRRPLLFLCDQMVQMLDNQYWWNLRSGFHTEDLIVDLYGNALLLSQFQHSFWPGKKIR